MVISKSTVSTLLKTSILQLCKASIPLGKGAEIDGILCVMVGSDEEQIVVRVHEKFPQDEDGREEIRAKGNHNQHQNKRVEHKDESPPTKVARIEIDDIDENRSVKVKVEQTTDGEDSQTNLQDIEQVSPQGLEAVEYVGKYIGSADLSTALSQELACNYCHYLLPSYEDLKKHNEGMHQAATCCYCWQSFTDRSVFTAHMDTHYQQHRAAVKAREKVKAEGKHKKCGICLQSYRYYSLMLEHLRTHQHGVHSLQCYTCFSCNSCFPDITSFAKHRNELHTDVSQCRCENCELYFSFEEFRHHERECVEPISVPPHQESVLIKGEKIGDNNDVDRSPEGEAARDRSNTTADEWNTSPGTMLRKVLQSDTCLDQLYAKFIPTTSPSPVENDNSSSGKDDQDCWDAQTAGGDYMSEGEENITLTGQESGRGISQSFVMSDTQKKTKEVNNYLYMCNICNMSTTVYHEYEKHCWTDHSRLVCSYCAMTFASQRNLQRHMRRHTGEKPFECSKCQKRFYRRDDMTYHHKRCLEPDNKQRQPDGLEKMEENTGE